MLDARLRALFTRCFTGDHAGDLDEMAWYSSNSDSKTHPVGTKKANAWGLSDMHGNGWEWCADWYGDYPKAAVTDPTGPNSGSNRVNRGGCWNNDGKNCRSANRNRNTPDNRNNNIGFRVAAAPAGMGWISRPPPEPARAPSCRRKAAGKPERSAAGPW